MVTVLSNQWGIRLTERMAGYLQFESSSLRYPFEFTIHAFTKNFYQYPIQMKFKGTASLPGFPLSESSKVDDRTMPVEGVLQISLKGVQYEMQCPISPWGSWTLQGKKEYLWNSFSWKKFRESLVHLSARWVSASKELHSSVAVIDLNYLPSLWKFPFGLRLVKEIFAYRPQGKLSEVFFEFGHLLFPDIAALGPREPLIQEIEKQLTSVSWIVRAYLKLSIRFYQSLSWLKFFKPFTKLTHEESERYLKKIKQNKFLKLAFLPLATTILYPLFSKKEYLYKKGQNKILEPISVEPEPWMVQSIPPHVRNKAEQVIEADCVIVGSGAGGAAFAYEMACQGKAVVVLEEGAYFKRQDLTGIAAQMMRRLYTRSGIQFSISNVPLWLPTGRCVGGTTFINSGTCMRTPSSVVENWKKNLGIEIFLEKYFSEVENMLGGVPPVDPKIQGGISQVLAEGLKGTGLVSQPLLRAEVGCDGQSACISGCPTGAKRSTAVSYLPEAMKKNAFLLSQMRVNKILIEDNKAVGVVAGIPGYGPEFDLTIRASLVVLAAGTLSTPQLIHNSGLKQVHLGKHLTVHPTFTVGGLFNRSVRESQFVPQSLGVFGLENEGYVLEGYTLPVDVIPAALGQWGDELSLIMNHVDHFTNFSSMLKDTSEGYLMWTRWGALPCYWINHELMQNAQKSLSLISKIFFNAGAKKVYLPIQGFETLNSDQDIKFFEQTRIHPSRAIVSAHHPLGTCRMGGDETLGSISSEGEFYGLSHLLVVDGSAIPGPLGVNPQITIMANALRIANIWKNRC